MKGVLQVSKEQVIEIERYCDEHGITRKQRIAELGLSESAYYYTHGLLSEEELRGGQFLPIMSGSVPAMPMPASSRRARKGKQAARPEPMTIELRTASGTEMRLMGSFSAEMVRTILANV